MENGFLTVPIQEQDRESKDEEKQQEKGSAAAVALDRLRKLFVSKLHVLCCLNRLHFSVKLSEKRATRLTHTQTERTNKSWKLIKYCTFTE